MKPGGKTNQWMHKDRKETVQHYHNKAARNQFQLLIWQCISYESLRKSTQTYFMNVCGYWPGLETGLEVVGSIISTKREKEKKKEENIWELITHGRQIQNETANSHATDTAILFKDRAGHHRPVTNTQSLRFLCLWPIHQCLSFPSYVIHVSPTYNIGTTTLRICKRFCLPPWQSHP